MFYIYVPVVKTHSNEEKKTLKHIHENIWWVCVHCVKVSSSFLLSVGTQTFWHKLPTTVSDTAKCVCVQTRVCVSVSPILSQSRLKLIKIKDRKKKTLKGEVNSFRDHLFYFTVLCSNALRFRSEVWLLQNSPLL